MTKEEIIEKLNETFRDNFDDDSIEVNENTVSSDIDGWDSLEHINLMVAVEETFDIKFAMGEISSMKNVGDMIKIIESKLN